MSEIVNSLTNLFSTYGFKAGCIIVCVIILVNIIKKPITKKALKLSESLGYRRKRKRISSNSTKEQCVKNFPKFIILLTKWRIEWKN